MPYFSYRGRNTRGELVTGLLEGGDSGAVADQLLSIGVTPIDVVSAAGPSAQDMPEWLQQLTLQRVGLVDLMLFSRQMHTLLKAGVPILRALAGLQESAINPALKRLIADLRQSLDAGRELSDAMRRHPEVFDTFYVSLVRVGEMTGLLEEVFMRLFQHLEFEKDMRDRIKAALRYPTFVIISVIAAVALINLFVIPVFARVFASFNAPLPLMTRVLVGASDITVQYWPLMLAAVVAAVVGFRSWVGTRAGKYTWDRYKLRIPIAGKIILKATMARFARSFALAVKSGVPVVQGLTVVGSVVDNDYIGQRIEQMRDGVERGESVLRTAAAAGVFTPIVLQMVAVGDETGELDDMLFEVAEMYEGEVDYEVKTLSAQIEPILLVALGGMVLVLALGVFLPIWELGQVALHGGGR